MEIIPSSPPYHRSRDISNLNTPEAFNSHWRREPFPSIITPIIPFTRRNSSSVTAHAASLFLAYSQAAFYSLPIIIHTITLLIAFRAILATAVVFVCLGVSVVAMVHKYDLSLYTYFDVKIVPEAVDQILASTQNAVIENESLVDVEFVGYVGELDNHLLYRVPKRNQIDSRSHDDELEEQRNKQVVDAISAISGVLHVDVQTLRQRTKKDEL
ncbi:hypothetical protein BGX21_006208 [Mortierella sp. AD011]|nr:hypothetical protein BGX20_010447 [Mortierella sp. AD010]KAF9403212.1 hypothetical protein BGX21_006208 [Mortierella sp. AD011]